MLTQLQQALSFGAYCAARHLVPMSPSPSFSADVAAAFAPQGRLAQALSQWQPRSGQEVMAQAVAEAVQEGSTLVVEAGTGVGKTFAYLVPAFFSGRKVVISTATKALQDQLFLRDAPQLLAQLGLPLKLVRLKGRSSYLCQHRLQQACEGAAAASTAALDPAALRALAQIRPWAQTTTTGDMAELPDLDEALLPLVTSTRSNCIGQRCAFWASCHVNRARAQALAADVCIVNHHLFFADQQLLEEGVPALLPQAGVVVVDEAHQLNDAGVQFAGVTLTSRQLLGFARDAMVQTTAHARGQRPWLDMLAALEQCVHAWRALAGALPPGQRQAWPGPAPQGLDVPQWQQHLHQVGRSLRLVAQALAQALESAPALAPFATRARLYLQLLAGFAQALPQDAVRWLERSPQHISLHQAPLTIASLLPAIMQAQQGTCAWVFTSATLGDTPDLHWFTQCCGLYGLPGLRSLRIPSPFDYARQARLYVPCDAPPVQAAAAHHAWVADMAQAAAQQLGGRTLVLTTTLKALHAIGQQLQGSQGLLGPLDVLVQGQGSKHQLLERFRQGTVAGRGCVLVASATFWEGVDIAGDALQLLIIDKLPFAPPDNPLVQARAAQQQGLGLSAFFDYQLPEAAMALKQGVGRLIRSESDRGLVVIADTRLLDKSYGPHLLAALPPIPLLTQKDAWQAALAQLCQGEDFSD